MQKYYLGIGALVGFVLILLAFGFSLIGSPVTQRDIQYDERRLSDFTNIKYDVDNFYQTNHQLPESLDQVRGYNTVTQRVDPVTNKPYDYHRVSTVSYDLCTTFSTDTKLNPTPNRSGMIMTRPVGSYYVDTTHIKGYDCVTYSLEAYLITPTPTPYAVDVMPSPYSRPPVTY